MALYFDGTEHDAHAYDGQALDVVEYQGNEVWSGAPEGALIWNSKIVSDELTQWTAGTTTNMSEVLDTSYLNLHMKAGKYNDSYLRRLDMHADSDIFTIPNWATKLVIDYELTYDGEQALSGKKAYIRNKKHGTSGTTLVTLEWGKDIKGMVDIDVSLLTENLISISGSLYYATSVTESYYFKATFSIKNMYFE